MKDLMIRYKNKNGDTVYTEYDTIMDFIDKMDADDVCGQMMEGENVAADFFENPLLHKRFNNINELYEHCKQIVR